MAHDGPSDPTSGGAGLPREPPARVYAGRGSGRACAVCGQAIEAGDVEYELEYGDSHVLLVHLGCYLELIEPAESP